MGCCGSSAAQANDPANGRPIQDKKLTDEEREQRRKAQAEAAEKRAQNIPGGGPKAKATPAPSTMGKANEADLRNPAAWN
eukprot:CAMPEP_0178439552 /NCGR_PEP_ID=MMETSP0689_2-20121128/36220_1 /TAXON_ID=160604 /ORGANISM="Amphidinium massartii, Strain CS-259" /LENGTH=79 /DNA_ID=CAMNT_0020062095 /DNA_START=70 /DNA_END=309 /DNA_ORIENTATION=-